MQFTPRTDRDHAFFSSMFLSPMGPRRPCGCGRYHCPAHGCLLRSLQPGWHEPVHRPRRSYPILEFSRASANNSGNGLGGLITTHKIIRAGQRCLSCPSSLRGRRSCRRNYHGHKPLFPLICRATSLVGGEVKKPLKDSKPEGDQRSKSILFGLSPGKALWLI